MEGTFEQRASQFVFKAKSDPEWITGLLLALSKRLKERTELPQTDDNYLSTSSGHVNDTIQIVGNGFGQNQTNIVVKFDSIIVKSGINANSTGSFKTTFQVPIGATKLGCHNVVDSVKNGISNTACFTIVQ